MLEHTFETESSVIAYGRRGTEPVVLKVVKQRGDEWRSGEVLDAFGGEGVVRVHEYVDGAVLLERLDPGGSLVEMAVNGEDDEATRILADVISRMSPRRSVDGCPTVEDWASSFERYASSGDTQIPRHLVADAHRLFVELCGSQTQPRLLHGDLHHYNVLFDSRRGWLAIDPKGVIGEIEYELGAAIRNPYQRPTLFVRRSTVERRLTCFASKLNIDGGRSLAWAFAQAVLSVIWWIEDGFAVAPADPSLRLADVIRPMLGR
jgi:streptomycin 6-kinase